MCERDEKEFVETISYVSVRVSNGVLYAKQHANVPVVKQGNLATRVVRNLLIANKLVNEE